MLTQTLSNALSGLKVNQQALAVISQNISNANNADYSRQTLSQESVSLGGEVGNGVRVKEVTRIVDEFIARTVVIRGSDVSRTKTISEYYDQVQQFYGKPASGNSIDSYIDNFFNSLNTLQTNPKDASIKLATVASAKTVAEELHTLSLNINDMRFQADKQIEVSVNNVNFLVKKLQNLNLSIVSASKNNASVSTLADSMQATLKELSSEIDINYRFNEDGTVNVTTAGGYTLLAASQRYELAYAASTSAEVFQNDLPVNSINIYSVDLDGTRSANEGVALATGGSRSEVTTLFTNGRIKGLMDVRDTLLPNMIDQLNNLATDLRDSINAIHNNGSAFPPLAKLTGDTMISPSDTNKWSGKVMIAALNPDGSAISSVYPSDVGFSGMQPLTLDLSKLDDGSGVGTPSVQGIIDEINQYYGVPQDRVKVGPLSNITLAAKSDALDGNSGTFNFNLDFTNGNPGDAKIVVTGVTVNNGAVVSVPASFPTTEYVSAAGTASRGLDFTLDMTAGTNTNYAVNVSVQVTDANGVVTNETITYNISEATSDLANRRYKPAAISGTGDGAIEAPTTTSPAIIAKLVDKNGVEVPKNLTTGDYLGAGYLVLEGANGNRVALSELDSKEQGINGKNATGRGFSHYFGLNNFFSGDGTDKAALNMAVRADIAKTPSLMSIGGLSRTDTAAGTRDFTYRLGESSTATVQAMVSLNIENHQFASSGTLPAISVTFSGYAGQILGFVSSATADGKSTAEQSQTIYDGFADRDKNMRGVNIDEEMANTIIFQNAYAANARVINVVDEMFDDLLAVFQ